MMAGPVGSAAHQGRRERDCGGPGRETGHIVRFLDQQPMGCGLDTGSTVVLMRSLGPVPHATDHEWLFSGASLALLAVPGPAVIYLVTRTLDHMGAAPGSSRCWGRDRHVRRAALAAAAGLIAASETGFTIVKYMGAAYLVYLGVRRLLERDTSRSRRRAEGPSRCPLEGVFQGNASFSFSIPRSQFSSSRSWRSSSRAHAVRSPCSPHPGHDLHAARRPERRRLRPAGGSRWRLAAHR
jgi:hypothetical protein